MSVKYGDITPAKVDQPPANKTYGITRQDAAKSTTEASEKANDLNNGVKSQDGGGKRKRKGKTSKGKTHKGKTHKGKTRKMKLKKLKGGANPDVDVPATVDQGNIFERWLGIRRDSSSNNEPTTPSITPVNSPQSTPPSASTRRRLSVSERRERRAQLRNESSSRELRRPLFDDNDNDNDNNNSIVGSVDLRRGGNRRRNKTRKIKSYKLKGGDAASKWAENLLNGVYSKTSGGDTVVPPLDNPIKAGGPNSLGDTHEKLIGGLQQLRADSVYDHGANQSGGKKSRKGRKSRK